MGLSCLFFRLNLLSPKSTAWVSMKHDVLFTCKFAKRIQFWFKRFNITFTLKGAQTKFYACLLSIKQTGTEIGT